MSYNDNNGAASGIVSSFGKTTQGHARLNQVFALFNDQKTVDALSIAPPIVRLFLEESGFGMKVSTKRTCALDAEGNDPVMRRKLIGQMSAALENRAMKKALGRASNESPFNIHDFIAAVVGKDPDSKPDETDRLSDSIPPSKVAPRRAGQIRQPEARRRARPV